MAIEYLGLSQINGPLAVLEGVQGAAYDEIVEMMVNGWEKRLGRVIETAFENGAFFDTWEEYFDYDRWMAAFEACGLDPRFYANRVRSKDEVLPWSVTSTGVTTPFLWRERERAYQAVITPDCRVQCTGCGANCLLEKGRACDE